MAAGSKPLTHSLGALILACGIIHFYHLDRTRAPFRLLLHTPPLILLTWLAALALGLPYRDAAAQLVQVLGQLGQTLRYVWAHAKKEACVVMPSQQVRGSLVLPSSFLPLTPS